ncbi:hypothetical protein [Levilactobacillus brevis]|uniref:hypothetical protein n=1 Tax=Levilactobacillus brevis TaxID=1580 RepID=UPI00063AA688|nr:hypothetical protein [Levilactobacillus brevis]KLE29442.1 hypothetical protein AAX72_08420 [Levilactobacillus brevis]MCT3570455.1 hypothetical protein [Levilactobacillus brevis]MCT3579638.1 hypothetical protein [Levilactobacillus brevis]
MKFFSEVTFSFKDLSTPNKVAGLRFETFQILIDAIIFRAWTLRESYGVSKYDFMLQAPINLVVGDYDDRLIVAFSFEKATNKISTLSEVLEYREPANPNFVHFRNAFYDMVKIKMGFNDAVFMELNGLSQFQIQEETLSKSVMADNYFQRFGQLLSLFVSDRGMNKCYVEFDKAANDLIKSVRNRKQVGNMRVNPIFKARDISVDENMVFCALPFTKGRLEIFDEVIKPKLESDFGMTVVRSGNMFKPNMDIMENIWTYINQAKIVIVDISDKNPNVYYELGMCHTLGKETIIICDEESYENDYDKKLPFDIGRMNTIFYHNTGAGPTKMVEDIERMVKAVKDGTPTIA